MTLTASSSWPGGDAESTRRSAWDIRVEVDPHGLDFDGVVDRFYADVYRFALSLAGQSAEAADLTQETFLKLARKGDQLRDITKVKSWLMTTVFREFNRGRRHARRFPHGSIEEAEWELPPVGPQVTEALDGQTVVALMAELDEVYRAPLALFFLEDFSYQEIAEVLEVPMGTVMSRLSRGKAHLRRLLAEGASLAAQQRQRIIGFPGSNL